MRVLRRSGWLAGVLLGVVCGVAHASGPACGQVVKVSSGVAAGWRTRIVVPRWADVVRATGVNGAVVFRVLVGCNGRVQRVEVLSGPEAMRPAGVKAVRQWRYRPYVVDGQVRPMEMVVTITEQFGAMSGGKNAPTQR